MESSRRTEIIKCQICDPSFVSELDGYCCPKCGIKAEGLNSVVYDEILGFLRVDNQDFLYQETKRDVNILGYTYERNQQLGPVYVISSDNMRIVAHSYSRSEAFDKFKQKIRMIKTHDSNKL